jgi:regulator of cell morphogenesis and NO signaling
VENRSDSMLRDVVIADPSMADVFRNLNIDYFCRGEQLLRDALSERGVSLDRFHYESKRTHRQGASAATPDWSATPLRTLAAYIVDTHHAYLHHELPLLDRLIEQHQPGRLSDAFRRLRHDLEVQMRKEETILFPAIADMEAALAAGRTPAARSFGSVANFTIIQMQQHRRTAASLHELSSLTNQYQCPGEATPALHCLYRRLQTLAADLQYHIHLENNILFPRAIQLEKENPV